MIIITEVFCAVTMIMFFLVIIFLIVDFVMTEWFQ